MNNTKRYIGICLTLLSIFFCCAPSEKTKHLESLPLYRQKKYWLDNPQKT